MYFQPKRYNNYMRRLKKIVASRMWILALLVLMQAALLLLGIYRAALAYSLTGLINLLALFLAIYVINKDEDSSYKIGWCFLILAMPLMGSVLFLLCFGRKMPKRLANGTIEADARMRGLLEQDPAIKEQLQHDHPHINKIFAQSLRISGFPIYQNTAVTYFNSGEEFFPVFLEELRKAKQFIFLEYYIISNGYLWDQTLEILKQKVAEGVEVKVIYDDFGCALGLPRKYDRYLNSLGIEAYRFNRIRPALLITMNNRDHRKICVIDNETGFTGGLNLSDEYINKVNLYGYWRDSAVMVKGEAVRTMTLMFLGMYSYLKKDESEIDYSRYLPHKSCVGKPDTYYQPFSDTPTDEADIGLSIHANLVNYAKKYIYIDTPYLVLNNDMMSALCRAAHSGVDVRILVPKVPDKKTVYQITQSNFAKLIRSGVRIYKYTPGFNHRKNIVCDDEVCLVGSLNTDYRSYFMQFESGILIRDTELAAHLRECFEQGLCESEEVMEEQCRKTNLVVRMFRGVLNLLAPLF